MRRPQSSWTASHAAHEGRRLVPDRYDDGAFSGTSLERPALQTLLADVRVGKINTVVVYKVDRLTRSLADFAKLVELFDQYEVSFVSITQSFNTTSSIGRLTLTSVAFPIPGASAGTI
jgi:site-specific DNA recombinase